jgi:hypothetical protein
MAHSLTPPPGTPHLSPEEIVRRLREEFAYVEVDREEGGDFVGNMVAKLIELKAPQAVIDQHMAARDHAFSIFIADAPASTEVYLQFVAMPEKGPFISYHSRQHQEAAKPLLDRCAHALDYTCQLI